MNSEKAAASIVDEYVKVGMTSWARGALSVAQHEYGWLMNYDPLTCKPRPRKVDTDVGVSALRAALAEARDLLAA